MTAKKTPARKAPAMPTIDVRKAPLFIKLDAKGKALPASAKNHVAVHLPQYGLIFDARKPERASSYDEALKQAKATTLLGKKGWTLPERKELELLIDLKRSKPALDSRYFTPTDDVWAWHWTATKLASAPAYAWCVLFYYGFVYYSHRSHSGFVRAVRRVPVRQ